MAQAAILDPADDPLPARSADPLGAVLALCSRAHPEPGGAEARELSRLLAAAGRAGGPGACERIAAAMACADWWTAQPRSVDDAPVDLHQAPDAARDERRLVDKLAGWGRLRPGLLLSALAEGRPALFHAALARLSGCDRAALEAAVGRSPATLALAVRAAGVDRAAFPAIARRLARLRAAEEGGAAVPSQAQPPEVALALALSPSQAAARLGEVLGG